MGIRMVSHAIMKFGTPAQKEFFLPGILTGEVFFCQGYSEPEAGSDLAALSMSAVDDGDDLICTGSKIWTTHAGEANWIFALVRTSRGERRQQGITFVLIDMTTPGIEIRPLVMTSGGSSLAQWPRVDAVGWGSASSWATVVAVTAPGGGGIMLGGVVIPAWCRGQPPRATASSALIASSPHWSRRAAMAMRSAGV